jgi:dienelactone hydrolase
MVAIILLAAWLPAGAARAEFPLEPAYPKVSLKGPQGAKGAVIWNHGINFLYGSDASAAPVPILLTAFRDAGWDVFRLPRPRMSEEPRASAAEVAAAAHRLKQLGYARIVLAGQSGGAWLSLMAAGRSEDIDAVIANAPAYYGTDHPTYLKNSYVLLDHVGDIRRGRIMISYFTDDPYDPGGRGAKSDEILAKNDVPHLVIDRPAGLSGHNAGDSGLFLRRFGACMLAVAGDGPMPTRESCASAWGRTPSAALQLPSGLTVAVAGGGPADPFLGKWYGWYANGREVMLVIERAAGSEVDAVYLVGDGPDPALKAGVTHRKGRIVDGKLVFEENGLSTLRYSAGQDGSLAAQWVAADGASSLEATLHRVN